MVAANITDSPAPPRWGEGLVLAAAAPGAIAAAVLGLGLALNALGWELKPGPVTVILGWVAVFSPVLVLIGTITLIGGVLAARHLPGRPTWKWCILIAGTLAWGLAAYWLSLPGLIERP